VLTSAGAFAQSCTDDVVDIRTDKARAQFKIEIADTPAEQAQGLMHRESMPRFSGMLFVYPKPTRATFWMRNTLLPLDMLFVDEAGVVQYIHENATPLSEDVIDGGSGVKAVLEINGGLSKMLGLGVGSQMRHPSFDITRAAWPCIE
jgi:uncharacterized membrane protein (UPF0127 family)